MIFRNLSFFFTLLLFLKGSMCGAQILKVDKADLDADSSDFFQGSVNLNFNINNRSSTPENSSTYLGLKAQADVVYFSDNHAYILINSLDYFTISDGPFISTGYAHFRINFLRKKPVSLEIYTQGQYDDGRNMPARFLQGAGVKVRLFNKENFKAYAGTGAMWEYEKWKETGEGAEFIEKKLWKSSNYFNTKYEINEAVSFNNTLYYQVGYDDEDEVFRNRVNLTLDLEVKLTEKLSFLTNFFVQYEDKPVIPINKYVYSLTNGLKLEF